MMSPLRVAVLVVMVGVALGQLGNPNSGQSGSGFNPTNSGGGFAQPPVYTGGVNNVNGFQQPQQGGFSSPMQNPMSLLYYLTMMNWWF